MAGQWVWKQKNIHHRDTEITEEARIGLLRDSMPTPAAIPRWTEFRNRGVFQIHSEIDVEEAVAQIRD